MKPFVIILLLATVLPGCGVTSTSGQGPEEPAETPLAVYRLPEPRPRSDVSLEEALLGRRSARNFSGELLKISEAGQLLWAAQGITSPYGGRTAPSAGALYPLEVYLVAGQVEGLAAGAYHYRPEGHELVKLRDGDLRSELATAAVEQSFVGAGPAAIVITAVYARTTGKYGERGVRYADMEAGHAAQNVCLQAVALELGAVTVGAFFDDRVREIVGAGAEESPLYIIPVGKPGR